MIFSQIIISCFILIFRLAIKIFFYYRNSFIQMSGRHASKWKILKIFFLNDHRFSFLYNLLNSYNLLSWKMDQILKVRCGNNLFNRNWTMDGYRDLGLFLGLQHWIITIWTGKFYISIPNCLKLLSLGAPIMHDYVQIAQ